jgi:adenylylsulfate kinase
VSVADREIQASGPLPRLADGATLWFTGLPSAGKTTLARALAQRLTSAGYRRVELLDGDVAREHLTRGLGFTRADRDENVRRIGWVAELLARNGVIVLCSVISPYRSVRDELRARHQGRFVEIYVATPVDVCSTRDVKGLYAKQRSGEITGLTGVDDPYEAPLAPEIIVPTHTQTVDESMEQVWQALQQ